MPRRRYRRTYATLRKGAPLWRDLLIHKMSLVPPTTAQGVRAKGRAEGALGLLSVHLSALPDASQSKPKSPDSSRLCLRTFHAVLLLPG